MKNRRAGSLVLAAVAACFLAACTNNVKSGTELLEKEKYGKPLPLLKRRQKKPKKGGDASEAYRGLGMVYYAQGDYESARTNLQKALEEGALRTPAIYNMIGACSMNLEDYDGALSAYEQGIELPDSMAVSEDTKKEQTVDYSEVIREMKMNRIICYEKKLDWESAKAAITQYTVEYPDDIAAQKEAEFLSTR